MTNVGLYYFLKSELLTQIVPLTNYHNFNKNFLFQIDLFSNSFVKYVINHSQFFWNSIVIKIHLYNKYYTC